LSTKDYLRGLKTNANQAPRVKLLRCGNEDLHLSEQHLYPTQSPDLGADKWLPYLGSLGHQSRANSHFKGKCACRACSTVTQTPFAAQNIGKCLPTAALLA
jgi:hypothetical protein